MKKIGSIPALCRITAIERRIQVALVCKKSALVFIDRNDHPDTHSKVVMKKKKKCADVDRELLLSELQSPDEVVRAKAVGSLCPCDKGWELFEQHVNIISRLTRDPCPAVRASALHVFDDAAHIQSIGDAEHRFQSVEDMLRKKRAPLLRSEEAELEVRRSGRFKKRKGSFVLR